MRAFAGPQNLDSKEFAGKILKKSNLAFRLTGVDALRLRSLLDIEPVEG